ncbi:virulence RhuM family protein [Uruburuella suis]|uniref:Virulence RhuM family protein n=1 Tax=Uruburuella suis TaxID=252130 RepID=A0AAE9KHZ5_9NEIS|nr:virulence RhuM family protein [Uruburuella suis]TCP07789.1 hypothetical protein EV680_10630 [Uruburuella suis]UOO78708.1 virulence RhuM family protein [Uruburuella suis]
MNKQMIIYNTEDGKAEISLHLQDGTVWLNQLEIAELFQTSKQNISKHIKAIFADGELVEDSTVNYQLTVQNEGERSIQRQIAYYNLDMILAVGYRIRSVRGAQFRHYASNVLKEYLVKGFAMDDRRLKELGGGGYFKELLERIRDIRSSEKVFYRQILDLFATSQDYNGKADEAKQFFATIQNKMHYAIHQHTAAELIYERVNAEQNFMGLKLFNGELPTLKEAKTAKNYLSEAELKGLNQLVSGYLDFAERQADRQAAMTMHDWIAHVDKVLMATGEVLLTDKGKISHQQMEKKVEVEYQKFQAKTLTQVEKDYLENLKSLEQTAKKAKGG